MRLAHERALPHNPAHLRHQRHWSAVPRAHPPRPGLYPVSFGGSGSQHRHQPCLHSQLWSQGDSRGNRCSGGYRPSGPVLPSVRRARPGGMRAGRLPLPRDGPVHGCPCESSGGRSGLGRPLHGNDAYRRSRCQWALLSCHGAAMESPDEEPLLRAALPQAGTEVGIPWPRVSDRP